MLLEIVVPDPGRGLRDEFGAERADTVGHILQAGARLCGLGVEAPVGDRAEQSAVSLDALLAGLHFC